ncbi:15887_t:CDS:2, partial [Dentiscutata erythropus]
MAIEANRLQLLRDGRCITNWCEEFQVIQQESYPLLKIKEENAFIQLPKNVYDAIENLKVHKLKIINVNINNQETQEQEFTNLNEDIINIIDNQEMFQKRKQEIFKLLDSTKKILEKNTTNPNGNKWLDSINKNFNSICKFIEDCDKFKKQKHIPKTWKDRNYNTF